MVIIYPVGSFLQQRPRKGKLLVLSRAVVLSHRFDERIKGQETLILVSFYGAHYLVQGL